MIIIKTADSDIIVNEAEIYSLIYVREKNVVSIFFKDDSESTKNDVISVKTYPGTPDMTFVNNIESEPEPEETPAEDYKNDSMLVLYKELDRIETEERERKRREHPSWGYVQKRGNATRAIVIARQHNIGTIGELLKVGRVTFQSFRNVGPMCCELITQGLSNLYGIEKW